jgi:membrane dipeptidase
MQANTLSEGVKMTREGNIAAVISTYGGPLNVDIGFKRSWLGRKAVLATDHLPNLRAGKLAGLVLPVDSLDEIRIIWTEISESENQIVLADNAEDISRAHESGSFTITLCVNYKTIEDDPGKLPFLRGLGVRLFSLSSNRRNLLADGCGERRPSGLSHLGVEVVKELERCGIFVDVSHLSEESFWDLLENTSAPLVATHSNARAVCDNPRNLSDAQIKAIAERGGLIGISTYPTLVAEQDASLEILLRHIDHIVELGGVECVAIGTDFVDFMGSLFDAALTRADPGGNLYRERDSTPVTAGIGTYSQVCNLVSGLEMRGYRDEELEMILNKNFMRMLECLPEKSPR